MPETGASGSVGAPSEQSEGATRQRVPSHATHGPLQHLFRLPLDLRCDVLKGGNCHFSARKSAEAL